MPYYEHPMAAGIMEAGRGIAAGMTSRGDAIATAMRLRYAEQKQREEELARAESVKQAVDLYSKIPMTKPADRPNATVPPVPTAVPGTPENQSWETITQPVTLQELLKSQATARGQIPGGRYYPESLAAGQNIGQGQVTALKADYDMSEKAQNDFIDRLTKRAQIKHVEAQAGAEPKPEQVEAESKAKVALMGRQGFPKPSKPKAPLYIKIGGAPLDDKDVQALIDKDTKDMQKYSEGGEEPDLAKYINADKHRTFLQGKLDAYRNAKEQINQSTPNVLDDDSWYSELSSDEKVEVDRLIKEGSTIASIRQNLGE